MPAKNKSQLDRILTEAINQDIDTLEFERARPEGLEVTFFDGPTGMGIVLPKEEEQPTLDDLFDRVPKLWDKWGGSFNYLCEGKHHKIKVEIFDSFGENAFRLKIR